MGMYAGSDGCLMFALLMAFLQWHKVYKQLYRPAAVALIYMSLS